MAFSTFGSSNQREASVKTSLTTHLVDSIKQIQMQHAVNGGILTSDEITNNFCSIVEAIFIHGLKDTFTMRISTIWGKGQKRMPEPDFWGLALVISHRDVINQVHAYPLITTDVGRSRAWLRLAMNEGMFCSYFDVLHKNQAAVKDYYKKNAYLRDAEQFDVAQSYLRGMEAYQFDLACNSSLLNMWTSTPLTMAGLWVGTASSSGVVQGMEAMDALAVEEDTVSLLQPSSSRAPTPTFEPHLPAFSEDDALRVILHSNYEPVHETVYKKKTKKTKRKKPLEVSKNILPDTLPVTQQNNDTEPLKITEEHAEPRTEEGSSGMGNSLNSRLGWSSSYEEETTSETREPVQQQEQESYETLLENYSSAPLSGTPDLGEFLKRYENSKAENAVQSPLSPTEGFEVLTLESEIEFLRPFLTKIAHEPGLDVQNYQCRGCGRYIGVIYEKPRVCSFTGYSYCYECHENDEIEIPAQVIYNWDFRKHVVSKHAKTFLTQSENEPSLNVLDVNPLLYNYVDEISEVQRLRMQLNYLRAYMATCRDESVLEQFRKKVWPREHLIEHVHMYSFVDLQQVATGALAQSLRRVIAFAQEHVANCWLCSQKGFICEVCSGNSTIFPFDLKATYRCRHCNGVYHRDCLDKSKPCPKCARKKLRDEEKSPA